MAGWVYAILGFFAGSLVSFFTWCVLAASKKDNKD
jgi:hypothetical protein